MKPVVNLKKLIFVLVVSLLLHIASQTVSDPLLASLLSTLEALGWFAFLIFGIIELLKAVWHWGPKILTRNSNKTDTLVPVEQLKLLNQSIYILGLALHDLTPEQERARCKSFQRRGERVPEPFLPPQNAILYAEFVGLVKMLNLFGFPSLESVRIQQKEFAFIQQRTGDLKKRLKQHQQAFSEQQETLCDALSTLIQQYQTLGEQCVLAQDDALYRSMRKALGILRKMGADNRCEPEILLPHVQKLQEDMDTLIERYKPFIR